ncbi:MAG: acyl carrier protein [Anaerolineae bacterium]|jgi:acyl carrier protein
MVDNEAEHPISFEAFRDIVAQALQVERGRVIRDASFVGDLAADSIKLVEMMLDMEKSGIEIPVESAWEVQTVGDAYRLYREHAPAPSET